MCIRDRTFKVYMGRNKNPIYRVRDEALHSPDFQKTVRSANLRWTKVADAAQHYEFLKGREQLMFHYLKVMADHQLDAIAHKAVEHSPTSIRDGVNPPFVEQKGAPHINTYLVFVPTIVVPAGFTAQNLPAGLCFLGRPYDDANLIKYAYAYEQATRYRRAPVFAK